MGSTLLLLLLPCIVSGYLLVNAKLFLARFPERTGSNLYFRILLVGSFWVIGWDAALRLLIGDFLAKFQQYSPYLGLELILATLLAVATRMILDLRFPVSVLQIFRRQARNLELFITEAIATSQLIMVTLSNGKVYVGRAVKMSLSDKTPEWLLMFAFGSGYRRSSDHNVEMINDYRKDLEQTGAAHGGSLPPMLLSVKEIVSIQVFNPQLHQQAPTGKSE